MTKVKICGITNVDDALKAAYYGAWAVGFVFHKKSPRYVSPSKVRKIIQALPPFVTPVGVFVNLNERAVRDVCKFTGIQTLQFHGDEDVVYCKRFKGFKIIKAFRVDEHYNFSGVDAYKTDAFLFDTFKPDTFGGTGETFNWKILEKKKSTVPCILSGGLNPENIMEALDTVQPYAVDVSSGVEKSPGLKDPRLIRAFMDCVKFKNQA